MQSSSQSKTPPMQASTTGPAIRLRPGTRQDVGALYLLDQACYRPGIAYSMGEMRQATDRPGSITLVAEDPGPSAHSVPGLAGFLIAHLIRRSGRRVCHIITIDVDAAFRRRGVGRLLMEAIEHQLAEAGVTLVELEVAADDPGAQQFYRVLGYEERGTIPGYYMGTLDAVAMDKELPVDPKSGRKSDLKSKLRASLPTASTTTG